MYMYVDPVKNDIVMVVSGPLSITEADKSLLKRGINPQSLSCYTRDDFYFNFCERKRKLKKQAK